jgi:hypothetical protein
LFLERRKVILPKILCDGVEEAAKKVIHNGEGKWRM